jgi:hypothetical protein
MFSLALRRACSLPQHLERRELLPEDYIALTPIGVTNRSDGNGATVQRFFVDSRNVDSQHANRQNADFLNVEM